MTTTKTADEIVLGSHPRNARHSLGDSLSFLANAMTNKKMPPETIVHVGAAGSVNDMSWVWPTVRQIILEPVLEYGKTLPSHLTVGNNQLLQVAASAEDGIAALHIPLSMPQYSSVNGHLDARFPVDAATRNVASVRIDNLVSRQGMTGDVMLIVDNRHDLLSIMAGCTGIVTSLSAVVATVPLDAGASGSGFVDVLAGLRDQGFMCFEMSGTSNRLQDARQQFVSVVFVPETSPLRNMPEYASAGQFDAMTRRTGVLPAVARASQELDAGTASTPYLSVIVCSRNDNYNGDAVERTSASVNTTIRQLERFGVDAEIVLVDYNTPEGECSLAESLNLDLSGTSHISVRSYIVSNDIHKRVAAEQIDPRPFVHTIAYNTGLRRARGQFMVISMIDHLYSDGLAAVIGAKNLDPGKMYRTGRIDVDRNVLAIPDWRERLAVCPQRELSEVGYTGGNFWPNGVPELMTWACGDFLLMHREVWHRLHGYHEYSHLHNDSLMMYAAYGAGIRQEVLHNAPLWHIDHDSTFMNTDFDRLYGKCGFSFNQLWPSYQKYFQLLGSGDALYDINGPDWGLLNDDVPCEIVYRAVWDKE